MVVCCTVVIGGGPLILQKETSVLPMWICWSTISCSIGTSMENSYRSSVAWSDLLWLLTCKQMVRDQYFLQQYAEACCSVVRIYRWTMSSDYMRRHYLYTVAAMHWAATGWVGWICRQSGEHFTDNTSVKLAGWIVITGVCFGLRFPNYMHCDSSPPAHCFCL